MSHHKITHLNAFLISSYNLFFKAIAGVRLVPVAVVSGCCCRVCSVFRRCSQESDFSFSTADLQNFLKFRAPIVPPFRISRQYSRPRTVPPRNPSSESSFGSITRTKECSPAACDKESRCDEIDSKSVLMAFYRCGEYL